MTEVEPIGMQYFSDATVIVVKQLAVSFLDEVKIYPQLGLLINQS